MYTTQKDKLKYLRKVCRDNGLIFKVNKNYWLNDKTVYMIVDKYNGNIVSNYHTIDSAYDNEASCSFISQVNNDADYL